MKRFFLLSILAIVFATNARSQSGHHLSVGVGTGLDGTSFEVATNLGSHVQVRLGYGTAFGAGYTLKGDNAVYVDVHPNQEVEVPLKLSFARNDARLLFNLYPSQNSVFHFTLGAYAGSGSFFKATLKDLPDEFNTGWEIGGQKIQAIDNKIKLELRGFGIGKPGFAVLPYAGLGFGRPVRDNKKVTFSFDLGAAYIGEPSLWASTKQNGKNTFVDITKNEEMDLQETIDEYGKYMNFWPVINFHLYFRIF